MPKKERKKERINAVKAYAEKNGKKIKRSAAALALAGLTTLSATIMSGCEDISTIIKPGNATHFSEPTIDPSTLNEDELTGEQVLALFDSLVWKLYVTDRQAYHDEGMSAQFDSITNCDDCGYGFAPDWRDHAELVFYGSHFSNVYAIRLLAKGVADSGISFMFDASDHYTVVACSKPSFDAVADEMGNGKYLLTEEMCNNQYYDASNRFIGTEVYSPFDITRDDILNATPEQVKLLYNLYQSIYSVTVDNIEPELPEGYTPTLGD